MTIVKRRGRRWSRCGIFMKLDYTLDDLAAVAGVATSHGATPFRGLSTDTRTLEPGSVFIALSGERFDGNAFVGDAFAKGACAAVTTKPHDRGPCIVVQDPLRVLQDFARFHRERWGGPVLALTGSCGKTSTKDMVASVLSSVYPVVKTQGNLNNEIGCPLSLLRLDDETGIAVVEMGANHAGEIARLCEIARPSEAVITLIAPAHLEGFGTIEDVARAKGEIVAALRPEEGHVFYVNADDPLCSRIGEEYPGEKIWFGRRGDVVLKSCEPAGASEMALTIDPIGDLTLPLICRAHATNVLIAVAVGLRHGVSAFEAPLREACAATTRLRILMVDGVEVIDDTYNANPASMAAALRTLAERPGTGRRIAVLGDMLELGEFSGELHGQIGTLAGELGVDALLARGAYADALVTGARNAGVGHAEALQDHDAIAEALRGMAREGDVVLIKGSRGMRMERIIARLREMGS